MDGKIKKSCKEALLLLARLLPRCFPRKKNLWIYGSWDGKLYGDNPKYMFEFVNAKDNNILSVWITKDPDICKAVRKKGYKCYTRFSPKGIIYSLRAEVAFITSAEGDISPFINRCSTKVIQLWHGMGMKAVGIESGWTEQGNIKKKRLYDNSRIRYSQMYWFCASEEAKNKYGRSFNVPEDRFFITGEPKGDTFANGSYSPYIEELRKKSLNARIAVYLPTHRNFGKDSSKADVLSLEKLKEVNEKLAKINAIIIFKPHFHEFEKYKDYQGQLSNIIFATNREKFGDVYEFLPACDMLITDYSGIMFGYLASGKPIIYFPYDKDDYIRNDAGFCYDYEDILYGPECMTWEEVVTKIATIRAEDYEEERERQRKRFCPYHDGRSCERAYNKVKKLLER